MGRPHFYLRWSLNVIRVLAVLKLGGFVWSIEEMIFLEQWSRDIHGDHKNR